MTQKEALEIMKTGESIFLTGAPGAGKTYVLNAYIEYLREHGIPVAVTASTGIAATHIGGSTIHSWSGVGIKPTLSEWEIDTLTQKQYLNKSINKAKVLIIDEISMVEDNFFNTIDYVCRAMRSNDNPFGGLQVILSGDMFQLPPIGIKARGAKYAFESTSWEELNPTVCYIEEQHRQGDDDFLSILTEMRKGEVSEILLEKLESRMNAEISGDVEPVRLYTHNIDVDRINQERLVQISLPASTYMMTSKGSTTLTDKLIKSCLSPEQLHLKRGALVMCTKNNFEEGYVNGTLGTIIDFKNTIPVIKTKDGKTLTMNPVSWEITDNNKVLASITQVPLRLAWAITVHKSQGMSIDTAEIDLSQCFEYGQGYVALSRVRSLSGLRLLGMNDSALLVDPAIIKADKEFRELSVEASVRLDAMSKESLKEMKEKFILKNGGTLKKMKVEKGSSAPKVSTHSSTLDFIEKKIPIKEIASIRGLTPTTVVGHIEALREKGIVKPKDIEYLKKAFLLKDKDFKEVIKAFEAVEEMKLVPIKDKFHDKYSFDELRFIRLFVDKKN